MLWSERRRNRIKFERIPKAEEEDSALTNDTLFDRNWEVFVIKRDEDTGEFTSTTVCCETALA